MQIKSIAEYSNGSVLQYFQPSLSYHLLLRSLFCLFLSCHFKQVLMPLLWAGIHKMVVRIAHREDPDQTAFSKAV